MEIVYICVGRPFTFTLNIFRLTFQMLIIFGGLFFRLPSYLAADLMLLPIFFSLFLDENCRFKVKYC